jgi:glutamine synthetase
LGKGSKRGLSKHKTTPEAVRVKISKKNVALFEEMEVMNKVELQARYEIDLEEYTKRIQIESRVLGDIARNHVVPTAIIYQNTLLENTKNLKEIFGDEYKKIAKEQIEFIMVISNHITEINALTLKMIDERRKANKLSGLKAAEYYCNKVKPFFEEIRYHCDKLETLVDDNLWPLTKYRELLFTR